MLIIKCNVLSIYMKILILSTLFFLTSLAFQAQANTGNQPPTAQISTTSPQVVSVGTSISLDATGSSDPESQFLFYDWSFAKKPSSSSTSFTTPNPSQPSFQADVAGLYVVQLEVTDIFNSSSDPQFLVFSVVAANQELTDNNSTPMVSDLLLETGTTSKNVSGTLFISDPDVGQSYSTEFLGSYAMKMSGFPILMLNQFSYTSAPGFKGLDTAYILTYDDGTPSKGVVSKISVNVNFNTAPTLQSSQFFSVEKNTSSVTLRLSPGSDLEGDSLTYSLVDSPPQGTISNCLGGTQDLTCEYAFPEDFIGHLTFSYKANDGLADSPTSTVILKTISLSEFITQIVSNYDNTCAIFNEGHIRCWGANDFGSLGLGHHYPVGDDEIPVFYEDVDVGENVLKLALGQRFTCALLESQNIKCWGNNSSGQLGLGHNFYRSNQKPSFLHPIDFGTTATPIDIAAGSHHACALFETGQIKCWGYNRYGQLGYAHTKSIGNAETLDEVGFVNVGGRVVSLSLGLNYTCALLDGGSIKCWGDNRYGQLGLGHRHTIGDNEVPSSIEAINLGGQAVEIIAGHYFSCARLTTGNVKCWGLNNLGQLGLGSTHSSHRSIGDDELPNSVGTVSLSSTVSQISSGSGFSCAIVSGNRLRCWGYNASGQLGLGHTHTIGDDELPSSQPVVSLREKVIQIATGSNHACALFKTGKVQCWGHNFYGQLGLAYQQLYIGDDENVSHIPNVIVGGDKAFIYPRFSFTPIDSRSPVRINFDASDSFSKLPGTSYSWNFGNGTTGSGSIATAFFPTPGTYTVNLTVTNPLSQKTASLEKTVRIQPPNDPPVMPKNQIFTLEQGKISSIHLPQATDREGNSLTYSLVDSPSQGTLTGCLNSNSDLTCQYTAPSDFIGKVTFSYRANDGTSDAFNVTQVELNIVPGQLSILQVSSFNDHTCALFSNKKIKCWGDNAYGQLGLGHTHTIGDNEGSLSQDFVNVGANVLQVSVGHWHTCVLLEDQSVKCWGRHRYGNLGFPGYNDISDPSSITPLDVGFSVKQIASGLDFNCALGESGQVKCWGYNSHGQLGYGHTDNLGDSTEEPLTRIPLVDIGHGVKKLSLGYWHACALLNDGNVKCWGNNSFGQLGLGHKNIIDSNKSPSSVSLSQSAIDISASYYHSCATLANKNIKCWGDNSQGELGLGHTRSISESQLPSATEELDFSDNVKQVLAGESRTCALFENNSAKCWGDANYGLLGYYFPHSYISNIAYTRFINFGAPIHHMALGGSHTCVALSTGEMRCFGDNFRGQLGLGHRRSIGGDQFITERNSSTFSDSRSTVVANFKYSVSDTNSQSVTFNSGLSFARNAIKSYQWNFGDDTTSTSANPTHDFTSYGHFDVALTVTDNFDQTASVLRRIRIERNNVSPYFEGSQKFTLAQSKTHIIQLSPALDFDSSSLTYTIVRSEDNFIQFKKLPIE